MKVYFDFNSAKVIWNFVRKAIYLEQTIAIIVFSGQLSGHNCCFKWVGVNVGLVNATFVMFFRIYILANSMDILAWDFERGIFIPLRVRSIRIGSKAIGKSTPPNIFHEKLTSLTKTRCSAGGNSSGGFNLSFRSWGSRKCFSSTFLRVTFVFLTFSISDLYRLFAFIHAHSWIIICRK